MRSEFIQALTELALKDKRLFLITGDLGYNVLEDFVQKVPDQFLNVGVAEQNMTGIAAGLALSGKIVFTYSIANFSTIRALEQVRNDICYHNASVKIVAVGTGFTYGPLASTHHGTEDLAIMRSLPNMTIVAPCDGEEAKALARLVVKRSGPCYIRIAKSETVYKREPRLSIGKAIVAKDGDAITFIAIGSMVADAMRAAEELEKKDIHARVLDMHTLKPLDISSIKQAARETKGIITIEEHSVIGGLGGAVAEVMAEERLNAPFLRIGVPDTFSQYIGDQDFLKDKYGLTPKHIVQEAMEIIKEK